MNGDTIAIIGVIITLFAALATVLIWSVNKIDADVKSACNRLDGHAQRIDQLYKMFVDLLRERK